MVPLSAASKSLPPLPRPAGDLASPACELCDDTGWAPGLVGGVSRVHRCACRGRINRTVDGLPALFADATLVNYQFRRGSEHAVREGEDFLGGRHDLFVFGRVGAGKTRLAATIAREMAQRGAWVAFRDVPHLIRLLLQAEFSRTDPHWEDPLAELARVEVLVLDDVGADSGSDFTRRELQSLYNARHMAGRRTIWTSNLDLDALAAFYRDDRLTSRISGAARVVMLEADDYRARGPREGA